MIWLWQLRHFSFLNLEGFLREIFYLTPFPTPSRSHHIPVNKQKTKIHNFVSSKEKCITFTKRVPFSTPVVIYEFDNP